MNRWTTWMAAAALFGIQAARAEVVQNDSFVLDFAPFVPCANDGAGEVVHLHGPLHVLVSFTINGNHVRGKTHYQPQGLSGIGEISGDSYQGTGATQSHFNGSFKQGVFVVTTVNNFRIIGRGRDNNLLVHENVHYRITPDGQFQSVHDNFSIDCK